MDTAVRKDIHSFGRSWSGYENRIPDTHPSPVPGDRSHHSMPEKKIDTFIISQIHCSADQSTDGFYYSQSDNVHTGSYHHYRVPRIVLEILFLNRSYILCYMAVEAVADIRSVRNTLNNSVHLTELFYLQTAETLCRCTVDCIQISIFLLKLVLLYH